MIWDRRTWLFAMILVLLALFGSPAMAAETETEESATPEPQAVQERLREALDQAVREGRSVVEIDLDEDPGRVQTGDLVEVDYTARLEDGRVFWTTSPEIANDSATEKAPWFEKPEHLVPEELVAGEPANFPGLAESVIGMAVGEEKAAILPPEKAFGPPDPKQMAQYSCVKRIPKQARLAPLEYVTRFESFPILGKEVNLTPYFTSRVVEITESFTTLESDVEDGKEVEEAYGTTEIRTDGDDLVLTLRPKIGAPFELGDRKGTITMTDGTTFTVDFNPPLAGKTIRLELQVRTLAKASQFKTIEIPWVEDHELALLDAALEGKPVVLVLYADWCTWSQRLLTETLEDPRIKRLTDRFIWAKINSAVQTEYKERYDQDGFPMIVLLDPAGKVSAKLDGFRDARTLRDELDSAISKAATS